MFSFAAIVEPLYLSYFNLRFSLAISLLSLSWCFSLLCTFAKKTGVMLAKTDLEFLHLYTFGHLRMCQSLCE